MSGRAYPRGAAASRRNTVGEGSCAPRLASTSSLPPFCSLLLRSTCTTNVVPHAHSLLSPVSMSTPMPASLPALHPHPFSHTRRTDSVADELHAGLHAGSDILVVLVGVLAWVKLSVYGVWPGRNTLCLGSGNSAR